MTQVEVIVLANSIKHGQHCVAGKCCQTGQWIRPVSNAHGAELTYEQTQYKNPYGVYPVRPLQKIRMGFSERVPLSHQPENFLIDGKLWVQNFSIGIGDLRNYLDDPVDLWGEGNRIQHALISTGMYNVRQSLYLVKVEDLNLYVNEDGKRKASFVYRGIDYELSVTDPKFDEIVDDQKEILDILCISLGEDYQGYCYKLVATIF